MSRLDDWAFGMIASAPQADPAMRELTKLHKMWLQTAELHRPYYGMNAEFEWSWPHYADEPSLYCNQEWTFVRSVRTHLVTKDGTPSTQVFHRAALDLGKGITTGQNTQILTTRPPSVPDKPRGWQIDRGDIRDHI